MLFGEDREKSGNSQTLKGQLASQSFIILQGFTEDEQICTCKSEKIGKRTAVHKPKKAS